MALVVDNNGDIFIVQGDSGILYIDGLNTDKDYTLYFALYNKNRVRIGDEISVSANRSTGVTIVISSALTNLLTVKKDEDAAVYYYAIKVCCSADGTEDTVCIGNKDIGELNTITVYPKKVEGLQ